MANTVTHGLDLELLRELAALPLPVTITEQARVMDIKALREAGLLLTLVYKVSKKIDSARVLALTPAGRQVLADAAFAAFTANDGSVKHWIPRDPRKV
ncbi:MAG: hypothetical protein V4614_01515 [Pseudomonadota bacterium]